MSKSHFQQAGPSTAKVLDLQAVMYELSPRLLIMIENKLPSDLRAVLEPHDVLQDTFFEAFQRQQEFRPEGEEAHFRWLATIARHRLAALIRTHRTAKRGGGRRVDAHGQDEVGEVVSLLEELAMYVRTPSQSAMSHELASAVEASLSRIGEDYRHAIRLRYIDGLSLKETAVRLRRSEGAVLMLCSRGMKALKVEMRSASLLI